MKLNRRDLKSSKKKQFQRLIITRSCFQSKRFLFEENILFQKVWHHPHPTLVQWRKTWAGLYKLLSKSLVNGSQVDKSQPRLLGGATGSTRA
jgi:hypothetical protein